MLVLALDKVSTRVAWQMDFSPVPDVGPVMEIRHTGLNQNDAGSLMLVQTRSSAGSPLEASSDRENLDHHHMRVPRKLRSSVL